MTRSIESNSAIIGTAAVVSIVLTLSLFFIDEGYYNFDWMRSAGNWIAFGIYAVALFLGQWLVSAFAQKMQWRRPHVIGALLGVPLAMLVLLTVVFN